MEFELRPDGLAIGLARGLPVTDTEFDRIYPESVRKLSEIHWTPVDVARRASQLLDVGERTYVLDVGSGVGKFCMVAALCSVGRYLGVEQRGDLVELSKKLVKGYEIPRVNFLNAKVEDVDWRAFTGIYLYNPFVEILYSSENRIDDAIAVGAEKYVELVQFVQKVLGRLAVGTRVVTFHGFGGEMPPFYDITATERWGDDYLVRWERIC